MIVEVYSAATNLLASRLILSNDVYGHNWQKFYDTKEYRKSMEEKFGEIYFLPVQENSSTIKGKLFEYNHI